MKQRAQCRGIGPGHTAPCSLNEYTVAVAAAFHVTGLCNNSCSLKMPISQLAAHFISRIRSGAHRSLCTLEEKHRSAVHSSGINLSPAPVLTP